MWEMRIERRRVEILAPHICLVRVTLCGYHQISHPLRMGIIGTRYKGTRDPACVLANARRDLLLAIYKSTIAGAWQFAYILESYFHKGISSLSLLLLHCSLAMASP